MNEEVYVECREALDEISNRIAVALQFGGWAPELTRSARADALAGLEGAFYALLEGNRQDFRWWLNHAASSAWEINFEMSGRMPDERWEDGDPGD